MKALVSCKKCGKLTEVDTSIVLTSNPPQYNYQCNNCGEKGYCFTSEVTWVISEQNKQDVCVSKVSLLESTKEELTKYKRAFEVLKSKEIFEFKDDNCLYLNAEDHNWWGDIIESSFVRLSDEEYELLEELMRDEIHS